MHEIEENDGYNGDKKGNEGTENIDTYFEKDAVRLRNVEESKQQRLLRLNGEGGGLRNV